MGIVKRCSHAGAGGGADAAGEGGGAAAPDGRAPEAAAGHVSGDYRIPSALHLPVHVDASELGAQWST